MKTAALVCIFALATGVIGTSPPGYKRPCPPLCAKYCMYGNQENEDGCPICRCNPIPRDPRTGCLILKCGRQCPNGFQINEDGCQTCWCNPLPAYQQQQVQQ